MASKNKNPWSQQNMKTLTNRMAGVGKGQMGSLAPGKQTGSGLRQNGRDFVDAYNLRNGEKTSKDVLRTLAETGLGRELTKREFNKLKVRELKSASYTETSRPIDPRTGNRLNLKTTMTAYRITFS